MVKPAMEEYEKKVRTKEWEKDSKNKARQTAIKQ